MLSAFTHGGFPVTPLRGELSLVHAAGNHNPYQGFLFGLFVPGQWFTLPPFVFVRGPPLIHELTLSFFLSRRKGLSAAMIKAAEPHRSVFFLARVILDHSRAKRILSQSS